MNNTQNQFNSTIDEYIPVEDNTNNRVTLIFGAPLFIGGLLGYSIAKLFKKNTSTGFCIGLFLGFSLDCVMMLGIIYALKNLT